MILDILDQKKMKYRITKGSWNAYKLRYYRLVIAPGGWDVALRAILQNRFAFGRFQWHNVADAHELLCQEIESMDELPSPAQVPSAMQYIAFTNRLLDRIPDDLLPVGIQGGIVVGLDPNQPERWSAFIKYRDESVAIQEVRVVGAGLPVLKRIGPTNQQRSAGNRFDMLEHSRQRGVIGTTAQRRIEDTVVTVVGCGSNGSLVQHALAMMGVKQLRILDADKHGIENTERTLGSSNRDSGQSKVLVQSRGLRRIRDDLTVVGLPSSVTSSEGHEFLRQRSDMIILCVDNDVARLGVNRIAIETLTPLMDIATSIQRTDDGWTEATDLRLCLPTQGCLACIGGLENVELLDDLSRQRPDGALPPRLPMEWNQQRAGSLLPVNMVAVGQAMKLFTRLITGHVQTSMWISADENVGGESEENVVWRWQPVRRLEQCPVCAND